MFLDNNQWEDDRYGTFLCTTVYMDRTFCTKGSGTVNADSLPKWVGRQISSLTVYEPTIEQRPEEKRYISDYGVIFVCNTIEQKFITCYEANDIIMEGKKITIHEYNVDSFKEEVKNLARKYYLKDAKEMLLSVESHLFKFQENHRYIAWHHRFKKLQSKSYN